MPTENPFRFRDVHTNQGAIDTLVGQAIGQGTPDESTLLTTGVFVDRDTVSIGDTGTVDVYEVVDLSTDSTIDISTFWNNTNQEIVHTAFDGSAYAITVGEYVAVNSEIAICIGIVVNGASDWDVSFYRGVAGTTIAAHGTGTDPIEVFDGTALTAGAITVPTIAVTQAAGLDALEAVIGNDAARGPFASGTIDSNVFGSGVNLTGVLPKILNPNWRFINYNDVTGFLVSTIGGARGVAVAEALTNGTLLPATTAGGSSANANVNMVVTRVPTAAEATAAEIVVPCNFEPTGASVTVSTTSTGAAVAWDGAVTLDRVKNLVVVDNTGLTNWAATDTLSIVVHGNVAVADAAVIG